MRSRSFLFMMLLGVFSYAQENDFNKTDFPVLQSARTEPEMVDSCNTGEEPKKSTKCAYRSPCCYNYYFSENNYIEIGGNYTYVHLKPESFDSVSGSLGGVQTSYQYRPQNDIYEAITFLWREGPLSGKGTSRSMLDIDVEARIGYTLASSSCEGIISLFTGLGYRHMAENVSFLKLRYNTIYIPVGFVSDWKINDDWYIGWNLQWRPQVYPTLRITLLKGARWITEYELHNFLVEVPLTYVVCKDSRFTIVFKPFFEYWQDGKVGPTIGGLVLGAPKNTYLFGGVMLNLGYSF